MLKGNNEMKTDDKRLAKNFNEHYRTVQETGEISLSQRRF